MTENNIRRRRFITLTALGAVGSIALVKNTKGPHGLQLMHHAKKGGAEAQAVLDYLVSIGAK